MLKYYLIPIICVNLYLCFFLFWECSNIIITLLILHSANVVTSFLRSPQVLHPPQKASTVVTATVSITVTVVAAAANDDTNAHDALILQLSIEFPFLSVFIFLVIQYVLCISNCRYVFELHKQRILLLYLIRHLICAMTFGENQKEQCPMSLLGGLRVMLQSTKWVLIKPKDILSIWQWLHWILCNIFTKSK